MALLRSLPRGDIALAAVLATYGLIEGVLLDTPAPWLLVVLAATLPLAWRRRFPVPVIGLVLGFVLAPGLLGFEPIDTVLPLPLIIVSAYTAGREATTGRTALVGAAAVGATVAAGIGLSPSENSTVEDLVALLVLVSAAGGAGHVMRVRSAENRRLQDLSAQLAAEQDLRARAAVIDERARVARELHDIVAHSVSLIAVQAAAADELLGRDDARARQSLRAVQETARGALGEMRRLLSVLRAEDEEPARAPQPGLAAVPDLVDQACGSGLPVELREDGERPALPAGIELSAFRIVQEALTNVRKHAGAVPTEVLVRYESDELLVEVSNVDARAPRPRSGEHGEGNGHGMAGMNERVRLYGGTLDAGRRDGRYVVQARLPLQDPAP